MEKIFMKEILFDIFSFFDTYTNCELMPVQVGLSNIF